MAPKARACAEFMQEMMPWWLIHMDLEGCVAAWQELVARVPGLGAGAAGIGTQASV